LITYAIVATCRHSPRRPHGMPADHFTRKLQGGRARSTAAINRDLLETHFMDVHMFDRFIPIEGMTMFHLDEQFMFRS
jgi:hypothetical protein